MKFRTIICFFAVFFIYCNMISAGTYLSFGGGVFIPNDDNEGLKGFDTGTAVDITCGYEVNSMFSIEGSIGYYNTDYEMTECGGDCPDPPCCIRITSGIDACPVRLTGKISLPLIKQIKLYAGAGFGYYFTSLDEMAVFTGYDEDFDYTVKSEADTFGYHLVAGLDVMAGESLSLLIETLWAHVKPSLKDYYSNDDIKVQMGGISLLVKLKYIF